MCGNQSVSVRSSYESWCASCQVGKLSSGESTEMWKLFQWSFTSQDWTVVEVKAFATRVLLQRRAERVILAQAAYTKEMRRLEAL